MSAVVAPLLIFLPIGLGQLLVVSGGSLKKELLSVADVVGVLPQFALELAKLLRFMQLTQLNAAASFGAGLPEILWHVGASSTSG